MQSTDAAQMVGKLVKMELQSLCSDKNVSVFRCANKEDMVDFQWDTLWLELCQKAPILFSFQTAIT